MAKSKIINEQLVYLRVVHECLQRISWCSKATTCLTDWASVSGIKKYDQGGPVARQPFLRGAKVLLIMNYTQERIRRRNLNTNLFCGVN